LQDVFEVGYLEELLSGVSLDGQISGASNPQSAGWTTALSQHHHWETLHAMDQALSGRVPADLRATLQQLRDAHALYTLLEGSGVQFDRSTGKDHVLEWGRAIREFQRMAGMTSP
jgi:aspartate oxidase